MISNRKIFAADVRMLCVTFQGSDRGACNSLLLFDLFSGKSAKPSPVNPEHRRKIWDDGSK
jgi:hypothetical protein